MALVTFRWSVLAALGGTAVLQAFAAAPAAAQATAIGVRGEVVDSATGKPITPGRSIWKWTDVARGEVSVDPHAESIASRGPRSSIGWGRPSVYSSAPRSSST